MKDFDFKSTFFLWNILYKVIGNENFLFWRDVIPFLRRDLGEHK